MRGGEEEEPRQLATTTRHTHTHALRFMLSHKPSDEHEVA